MLISSQRAKEGWGLRIGAHGRCCDVSLVQRQADGQASPTEEAAGKQQGSREKASARGYSQGRDEEGRQQKRRQPSQVRHMGTS